MELSITTSCNLACVECGFFIPNQPSLGPDDPIDAYIGTIETLHRLGVQFGSVAILGGEPTLSPQRLERILLFLKQLGVSDRIEVVTNGMRPQGLTPKALNAIDRISISIYSTDESFYELWKAWLGGSAPHIELILRRSLEGWDPVSSSLRVSEPQARAMYDSCWYRRHCTTIERGRVFHCPRIAKTSRDDEGLLITEGTTLDEVVSHLESSIVPSSCATCAPMMGLPTVKPGQQPDNRLEILQDKASQWLRSQLSSASATQFRECR